MSEQDNQDKPKTPGESRGNTLAEMSESTAIIDTAMLQQARAELDEMHQAYLIVISGPHVGRMIKLEKDITLGRSPKVDLELSDTGISRKHARFLIRGDEIFVEDLQSANGTYVNGRRISSNCELQQGDKITLGTTTILKFTYQDKLDEDYQRQMFDAALRDELTGAYNKKFMMTHLRSELARALRKKTKLSMLMFDVDHFKNTNDTYGHLAGDRILAGIGEISMEAVGPEDRFVRYGGEEFAVICRDMSIEECARLGNRIRKLIERYDFVHEGQHIPVTVSVGVSGIPGINARTPDDLIAAADEALYAAKNAGRNRVMLKSS
jgi:diguanylate cyclase (GGDEF)-like protein